jgi:hypothetical protein
VALAPLAPAPHEKQPFGPVPRASDIKGLKFYLDCDAIDDGTVRDAASKKSAGKLNDGHLVDGARGKALRLTTKGGTAKDSPALALDPALIGIDADKPFTFALWVRHDYPEVGNLPILSGYSKKQGTVPCVSLAFRVVPKGTILYALRDHPKSTLGAGIAPLNNEWVHVALVRDEKNEIRFYLNGTEAESRKTITFAAALQCDEYTLVYSGGGRYTLDVDEFCVFDRALTAAEVKRLAGRAEE